MGDALCDTKASVDIDRFATNKKQRKEKVEQNNVSSLRAGAKRHSKRTKRKRGL